MCPGEDPVSDLVQVLLPGDPDQDRCQNLRGDVEDLSSLSSKCPLPSSRVEVLPLRRRSLLFLLVFRSASPSPGLLCPSPLLVYPRTFSRFPGISCSSRRSLIHASCGGSGLLEVYVQVQTRPRFLWSRNSTFRLKSPGSYLLHRRVLNL